MGEKREVVIREARAEDAAVCGRICYQAFASISGAHGFPCDLPSEEFSARILSMMFAAPGLYSVVAEVDGVVAGSNVLNEQAIVAGVGPITVDPSVQNLGVGRKLMDAVMERAKGAVGVRLVQAAYHNRSLSLYTALGFDVREPLSCLQGEPPKATFSGCVTRPARAGDEAACDALARRVYGFDRGVEVATAIGRGTAVVVERDGRITGYASELAFFGHATAETNLDLQALIASAKGFGGPGILVPSRNSALLRWCLAGGMRVVQPMTLMSRGLYNEPAGAWLPSIVF